MKLLHLYYDLMNLYGEYGNVVVLHKHLIDQGFEVVLDKKSINDDINFEEYDFIYCGSGTEKNELVALNDLLNRKDSFNKAIEKGSIILFTGNAMELLGNKINDNPALNIANIETIFTNDRYTGDAVMRNDKIGEVVGFINKCSIIKQDKKDSLFEYIFKDENIKDNTYEGYRINNVFGTHLIGPILVKNPNFMKEIVCLLANKENKEFVYKDIAYPFEEDSYEVTLNALKQRIK